MATINMHMKFEIEIPKQTWLMLRKPCRLQTDGQTDRRTDGRTDKVNPVYPPSNFVGRGYNKDLFLVPCLVSRVSATHLKIFKWILFNWQDTRIVVPVNARRSNISCMTCRRILVPWARPRHTAGTMEDSYCISQSWVRGHSWGYYQRLPGTRPQNSRYKTHIFSFFRTVHSALCVFTWNVFISLLFNNSNKCQVNVFVEAFCKPKMISK